MSLSTPVAFLIFNRPELTQTVFEAIRQAKPQKLLVVADGARFPEEVQKCKKTREIINQVDWECKVLTNFSEINLGCKKRISSGLDWVFSEVEEAIILEDDCLPSPSFFNFCQTLLEYYRHDARVMHISGNNFIENRSDRSYRFSKYNHIWGWASWSKAWKHYDVEMKSWSEYRQGNFISSVCEHLAEQKYWTDIFDRVFAGSIDTWDYQWTYACWSQSGLSILPNANLISNIGFGLDSTHTKYVSPLADLPVSNIWNISHPVFVSRDRDMDDCAFDLVFDGKTLKNNQFLLPKIKHSFSRIKGKVKLWL